MLCEGGFGLIGVISVVVSSFFGIGVEGIGVCTDGGGVEIDSAFSGSYGRDTEGIRAIGAICGPVGVGSATTGIGAMGLVATLGGSILAGSLTGSENATYLSYFVVSYA